MGLMHGVDLEEKMSSDNNDDFNKLCDKWDFKIELYFDREKKSLRYCLTQPVATFDSINDAHNWIIEEFEEK